MKCKKFLKKLEGVDFFITPAAGWSGILSSIEGFEVYYLGNIETMTVDKIGKNERFKEIARIKKPNFKEALAFIKKHTGEDLTLEKGTKVATFQKGGESAIPSSLMMRQNIVDKVLNHPIDNPPLNNMTLSSLVKELKSNQITYYKLSKADREYVVGKMIKSRIEKIAAAIKENQKGAKEHYKTEDPRVKGLRLYKKIYIESKVKLEVLKSTIPDQLEVLISIKNSLDNSENPKVDLPKDFWDFLNNKDQ